MILDALVSAYDSLADLPARGFTDQTVDAAIVLNLDGKLLEILPLSVDTRRKRKMHLFDSGGRSSQIAPHFLWDNGTYCFGIPKKSVSKVEAKRIQEDATNTKKAEEKRSAFSLLNRQRLEGCHDVRLRALCRFLEEWTTDRLHDLKLPDGIDETSVFVFAVEDENGEPHFLHELEEAKTVHFGSFEAESTGTCLITGRKSPISRLHGGIKGVIGTQSSGAMLVSFNADAFTSYGWSQGDNAPVGEDATFKYTTVLNRLLETSRIMIGETTCVFWVSECPPQDQKTAEGFVKAALTDSGGDIDYLNAEAKALLSSLSSLTTADGRLSHSLANAKLHLLGMSGNVGRISVRFWHEGTFEKFFECFVRYGREMMIVGSEDSPFPSPKQLMWEVKPPGSKPGLISKLAGEWAESVVKGRSFPSTLIQALIVRIRTDGYVTSRRVALLKAALIRNHGKAVSMSLDLDNVDKGYLLGRLFSIFEGVQFAALGNLNASIKDRYYSSASTQPRRTFSTLSKLDMQHLSKLKRTKPKLASYFEKRIAEIISKMDAGDDPFPAHLTTAEQALFTVGYYHEKNDRKKPTPTDNPSTTHDEQ